MIVAKIDTNLPNPHQQRHLSVTCAFNHLTSQYTYHTNLLYNYFIEVADMPVQGISVRRTHVIFQHQIM